MVHILSDSTCDLSPELIRRYNITIIPLHVRLGDDEFLDGVNITPDEIYAWADRAKDTPKTVAPSIEQTAAIYEPLLADGSELVVLTLSESMSVSNNVCRLAAQELDAEDRIHVIDSANLSTGVGHLVIEAAVLAEQGYDAAGIEAVLTDLRPRVRASFVVDTLIYLYRGGRCSGLAAMAGSALRLHPRIGVADGAMASEKKYRGHMDKVIPAYVKDMEADLKAAKPDRVFITHSGVKPEVIETVKTYIESLGHFKEILITRAGSVISSHCGPGVLGVLFIAGK